MTLWHQLVAAGGLAQLVSEWYWVQFDWHAEQALKAYRRDQPWAIAFDTETTGVEFFDTPFCVTVAWEGESHYIELGTSHREAIAATLLQETATLICHNAKFDLQKVVLVGLLPRDRLTGNEDTQGLAALLDEHQSQKLKDLAKTELGQETSEDAHLKVVRRKLKLTKDDGYDQLPRAVVAPYAVKDAEFTWSLFNRLRPRLARYPEVVSLYDHEMELTQVLLDMEGAGMALDIPYVKRMTKEYHDRIRQTEQQLAALVGRPVGRGKDEFNPASVPQIKDALADRGIKVDGTSKDILGTLDDDLARGLLRLREDSKLRSTYLVPMLKEQRDGIIHPNFRQFGTVTGRMSSGAAAA